MWLPRYRVRVGVILFVAGFVIDALLGAHALIAAPVFALTLLWAVYGKGKPTLPEQKPEHAGGHMIPAEWGDEIMRAVTEPLPAMLRMMPEPPPPTLAQRARRRARLARWAIGRAFWRVGVALAPHLRYEGED